MTEEQSLRAQSLERCSFPVGSTDKRFVRDMAARSRTANPPTLTDRQAAYLTRLAWRYRRQMPRDLVPPEAPQ